MTRSYEKEAKHHPNQTCIECTYHIIVYYIILLCMNVLPVYRFYFVHLFSYVVLIQFFGRFSGSGRV